VAVDPVRQVVFATPAYLAFVSRLVPREDPDARYVSQGDPALGENFGAPFAADLHPFVSPLGLPCQAPPWGYVAGADLRTGEVAWRHKNGTVRDRAPVPLPFEMGVPDLGGPVMTAGGVAFISGTLDYYVRAYDVTTGEQLWQDRLPAGGQATPMTISGRADANSSSWWRADTVRSARRPAIRSSPTPSRPTDACVLAAAARRVHTSL